MISIRIPGVLLPIRIPGVLLPISTLYKLKLPEYKKFVEKLQDEKTGFVYWRWLSVKVPVWDVEEENDRSSFISQMCCIRSTQLDRILGRIFHASVFLSLWNDSNLQYLLWPFNADTTPWLRQRAHLGVLGYLSAAVLRKTEVGDSDGDAGDIDAGGGDDPSVLILIANNLIR